jgi:aminoglycoside 6'-N-acetyltransferase
VSSPGTLSFRCLERADFATLARWLAAPHVARWWRHPATLEFVEREYGPHVDGDPSTEAYVVELDGHSIGLIQRYRHRDHPDWEQAVAIADAAGIDYLIGEVDHTGRGIGSAAIGLFASDTLATYPEIRLVCAVTQQDNMASRKALGKAGFELFRFVERIDSGDPSDEGPSFVYVLRRPPTS